VLLRGLVRVAGPFALTGLGYDFLRLAMPLRGRIHVDDLWRAENALFGITTSSGRLVITDWIATHTHPVLDAIFGGVYVLYLIVPLLVAASLYARVSVEDALIMSSTFAVMSVIGWFIWLAWPAAPPWYVDRHGLGGAVLDAAPSAAGGARFDDLFGVNLFRRFYERSWNVFGAMPSLHVAYGMLPLIGTWRLGWRARLPAALWAAAMFYASVYLRHHYILDGLAGVAVALAGLGVLAALRRALQLLARDRAASERERLDHAGPAAAPSRETTE
jgi:membrane-associated phospholipid phosphatase